MAKWEQAPVIEQSSTTSKWQQAPVVKSNTITQESVPTEYEEAALKIFESEGITKEMIENNPDNTFAFQYEAAKQERKVKWKAIQGLDKRSKDIEMSKMNPLELIEAVEDMHPIKDFSDRRKAIKILQEQGLDKNAIVDYLAANKVPAGIKGAIMGEIPETGGEIIGGLVGAYYGQPIKGAAAGRAVGSLLEDIGQRIFLTERNKTIGQDIKDIGWDAAEGALSEFGSRKVIEWGGKILKPAGKTQKAGIARLQEKLTKAGEQVIAEDIPEEIGEIAAIRVGGRGLATPPVISPGAATNSKFITTMDNITDKAMISMDRIQRTRLGANIPAYMKVVENTMDNLVDDLGKRLTPTQVGVVLNEAIEGEGGAKEAAKGIYRNIYKQLDNLTGNVDIVDNAGVKKVTQEMVELVESGKLFGDNPEGAAFVKRIAKKAADKTTFTQAIMNKSTLLSQQRAFKKAGDVNAVRNIGKIIGAMDDAMEIAAKKQGGGAVELWRRGAEVFKAVDERFNHKVIRELSKQAADNPELAIRTVFNSEKPSNTLYVKKILLSPSGKTKVQIEEGKQTWKQLQQSFATSLIKKSESSEGIVFGITFGKTLKQYDDVLKTTFNPQQIRELKDIAVLGKMVQGKIQGEGGMLIQLMQPGAAAGLVAGRTSGIKLTSLAVLGIPQVWARIITDPMGAKLVREGLIDINKEGIKVSTAATVRLTKMYFKVRSEYLKEQQAEEKRKKIETRFDYMRIRFPNM